VVDKGNAVGDLWSLKGHLMSLLEKKMNAE